MNATAFDAAPVLVPQTLSEAQAVAALAALAQPARLCGFRALVGAGPEGVTPGVLATGVKTLST